MSKLFRKPLWILVAVALPVAYMSLSSTSSASPSRTSRPAGQLTSATATFALQPGNELNWIFPIVNSAYDSVANDNDLVQELWRPLYWFGGPGKIELNDAESLAYPATITTSGGHTTATMRLKPYRWSDGKPVTARDVQFWFNLLRQDKTGWWDYTAGLFPDNVINFRVINNTTCSITFNTRLASPWIYNELAQLVPMPQHAWDKTSAGGPVRNYDLTPSGAKSVVNFLLQQNKLVASYATSPIWKVVDGPWKVQSIDVTTGGGTLVRNPSYSGPATGNIKTLVLLPFTSNTAEFNELLSGHSIDYGYVPAGDTPEVSRLTSDGYKTQSWTTWGITFLPVNFANPVSGPLVRQLYIRQALQELIDQPGYIKAFFDGYAVPTNGPVPLKPLSDYVSSAELHNPYPYSPSAATKLLRTHGWQIHSNGTDVCKSPGAGPGHCGAGITSGEKLKLTLLYATGVQEMQEEVTAMQSADSSAGISMSLHGVPFATELTEEAPCAGKASCYQIGYPATPDWIYAPYVAVPDGSELWASTGGFNDGHYSNATADKLLADLKTGGVPAIKAYENFLTDQVASLWMPAAPYQISVISKGLTGALPQDPGASIYAENWHLKG